MRALAASVTSQQQSINSLLPPTLLASTKNGRLGDRPGSYTFERRDGVIPSRLESQADCSAGVKRLVDIARSAYAGGVPAICRYGCGGLATATLNAFSLG